MEYNEFYKIVVIGDISVGKTNIIQKYTKGFANKNPIPTIGVEFSTKTIPLSPSESVKAQIWDTTGQQKYRSVTTSHYRKADAAIIVYDVTKPKSFQDVRGWLDSLREIVGNDITVMLVGNKIDLPNRAIRREEAESFARQSGLMYEEVSATNGNVSPVFQRLMAEVHQKRKFESRKQQQGGAVNLNNNNIQESRNKCC